MSHPVRSSFFACLILIFCTSTLLAQSPEDSYAQGIRFFQEGKFAEAEVQFESVLKAQPSSGRALFNLGLCYQKTGRTGLAIARWRMAQAAEPISFGSKAERAIEFAMAQMKVRALPHQITTWESLRSAWVARIPTDLALGITAFFLIAFGWFAVRLDAARPALGSKTFFSGLFFLLGTLTVGFRVYDYFQPRATIVVPKVEARSGPGSDQSVVVELFEGLEVLMEQVFTVDQGENKKENWVQVTYPGGQTGWVPEQSILLTSGKAP